MRIQYFTFLLFLFFLSSCGGGEKTYPFSIGKYDGQVDSSIDDSATGQDKTLCIEAAENFAKAFPYLIQIREYSSELNMVERFTIDGILQIATVDHHQSAFGTDEKGSSSFSSDIGEIWTCNFERRARFTSKEDNTIEVGAVVDGTCSSSNNSTDCTIDESALLMPY